MNHQNNHENQSEQILPPISILLNDSFQSTEDNSINFQMNSREKITKALKEFIQISREHSKLTIGIMSEGIKAAISELGNAMIKIQDYQKKHFEMLQRHLASIEKISKYGIQKECEKNESDVIQMKKGEGQQAKNQGQNQIKQKQQITIRDTEQQHRTKSWEQKKFERMEEQIPQNQKPKKSDYQRFLQKREKMLQKLKGKLAPKPPYRFGEIVEKGECINLSPIQKCKEQSRTQNLSYD